MRGTCHGAAQGSRRNVARYFTENPHVAWVLLAATLLFGTLAYLKMPKRKDPLIRLRVAVAVSFWPGAAREKVEELITRRIEEKVVQNQDVDTVESTSRTGVSVVTLKLRDGLAVENIQKTMDDIDFRLRSIQDLPPGASPIDFQKDFGDTAALLLTVASPHVRDVEVRLRARALREALVAERREFASRRSAIVFSFPAGLEPEPVLRVVDGFAAYVRESGQVSDLRTVTGPGFVALDGSTSDRTAFSRLSTGFLRDELTAPMHPEMWAPVTIDDPAEALPALTKEAGDEYSYRQLDDWTFQMGCALRALPAVAKVTRSGVLEERVYLDYSQEKLSGLGIAPSALRNAIGARNVQTPGGVLDAHGRTLAIEATGEYQSERDIGATKLSASSSGAPVFVGDVVDVTRDYESPLYLNYLTRRDEGGHLARTRSITLAVQMRSGEQIARFSEQVGDVLAALTQVLPEDLIIQRTSDQAKQVTDKVGLFVTSLIEAIAIIVFLAFAFFGEWRSALVLAISIPVTLALTFIFMAALGIDIQQVSLAALILSLGLLVDDPVVAGDAIQQELDDGKPPRVAAWLGPTRLGKAILFATVVNVVAYLPFLLFSGDLGRFIYTLPVVLTCSLVASRIVSMTFIPMLGLAILRPRRATEASSAIVALYRRLVTWSIARRYQVLGASLVVIVAGSLSAALIRVSFFPSDHSPLLYADIFLPEDSSLHATNAAAVEAEAVVRKVTSDYGRARGASEEDRQPLRSITSFVGGGAPRFWYALSPEPRQLNYAQLVIELDDERDSAPLMLLLQDAMTAQVPGARIDVRELENGKPIPRPVEIRFSGDDPGTLRLLANRTKDLFDGIDIADRVRDDWGESSFRVTVAVDAARAALAGVSNADVADTSAAGFNGVPINVLRDGGKLIPIVARLRYQERTNAGELGTLDVPAQRGGKVPLGDVARISYRYDLEKINHRDQRRTIAVSCFPIAGKLPSEVMNAARNKLQTIRASLPPGYTMTIGGAEENLVATVRESEIVGFVSIVAIYLALVLQFKHALKPLLIYAAIPFGVSGALFALVLTESIFGFTAILGVISLVGVIVSHVIVLFDYIEERREVGVDIGTALLNAGSQRLRPVLVTTGATVFGLLPLAIHGGPLWEPLCFAEMGGLTVATAMTLVLVPTLYAVFVIDLRWIQWKTEPDEMETRIMPVPLPADRACL